MKNEYIPTKPVWLVFDLNNGHAPTKRYVWWFDTRKAALEHIRFQRKNEFAAKLSRPMRFFPAGFWGEAQSRAK